MVVATSSEVFIVLLLVFRQEEVETEGDKDGSDGDRGLRHLLAAVLAVPSHRVVCERQRLAAVAEDVLSTHHDPDLRQQYDESDPLRVLERQFPTHVRAVVRLRYGGRGGTSVEEDGTPAVAHGAG